MEESASKNRIGKIIWIFNSKKNYCLIGKMNFQRTSIHVPKNLFFSIQKKIYTTKLLSTHRGRPKLNSQKYRTTSKAKNKESYGHAFVMWEACSKVGYFFQLKSCARSASLNKICHHGLMYMRRNKPAKRRPSIVVGKNTSSCTTCQVAYSSPISLNDLPLL